MSRTRHSGSFLLRAISALLLVAGIPFPRTVAIDPAATPGRSPRSSVRTGLASRQRAVSYQLAGELIEPGFTLGTRAVEEKDGYAYLLTRDGNLYVYELGNLVNRTEFASLRVPVKSLVLENGSGLLRNGSYLYAYGSRGLDVIDVREPDSPVVLGSDRSLVLFNLSKNGEFLVASGSEAVGLYRVSDPANPEPVTVYPKTGSIFFSAVQAGKTLYAAVMDGTTLSSTGIQVIDISDVTRPTLVTTLNNPAVAFHLRILGDYLVAAGSSNLSLWRVGPTEPSLQDKQSAAGQVCAVDDQNMILNGQVFHIEDGHLERDQVFRPNGRQGDGFPYGGAVSQHFVLLAQSNRVLILRKT